MAKSKKQVLEVPSDEIFKMFESESIEDSFIASENILDIVFPFNTGKTELLNFPVRLEQVVVILCLSGYVKVKLETRDYKLEMNSALVFLPKQIFEVGEISSDFKSIIFIMQPSFWDKKDNFWETTKIQEFFFRENELKLSEEMTREAVIIYRLIKDKMESKAPFSMQIIRSYMRVLFYSVYAILLKREMVKADVKQPVKEYVLEQFVRLVERNFKQHHEIGFYADQLKMSPKYLSETIRAASGKTAAQWIREYLIVEARVLLKSGKMSVQQVSYELNFYDQSHFGVFFKKYTGCSPREYQKR
jgi:AraC-like DNA-binding protein